MNPKQRFGAKLKQARENKGLSQLDLCSVMNDGLNQSLLSKYETGESMPRQGRLKRFCDILGVTEAWLRGLYSDELEDVDLVYKNLRLLQEANLPPGCRSQDEELRKENLALQQAELSWQRKELESQRQVLELEKKLLDRDAMIHQLLEKLCAQTRGIEALIPTFTPQQQALFLQTKASFTNAEDELLTPEKRLEELQERLKSSFESANALSQELETA
jgi:transcriptional regulator with XRE-family HTH domain